MMIHKWVGEIVRYAGHISQSDATHAKVECAHALRTTSEYIQWLYYKHVMRPSLERVVMQERWATCLTCILYVIASSSHAYPMVGSSNM